MHLYASIKYSDEEAGIDKKEASKYLKMAADEGIEDAIVKYASLRYIDERSSQIFQNGGRLWK